MTPAHEIAHPQPSFGEFFSAFARIGVLSFGGPAAQISLMHRICVDEKRWIRDDRFLHALNYCMLLPGPEAQQLATYIGWLMFGVRGGIIAGLLFVLPGLLVILGLSAAYALFQQTDWLTGLFFGLKAGVLAIVVQAVIRLASRALKTRFHRIIALLAFVALFFLSLPFPLVVLSAGLAGLAMIRLKGDAPTANADTDAPAPRVNLLRSVAALVFWILVWQAPLLILMALGSPEGLAAPFAFFSKMALVTFGGAYAVLAYVAQVVVEQYQWLQPGEMLDGLALAETTPGPLVLVLSFVGFMAAYRDAGGLDPVVAGLLGGLLTAWATFVPSFIWIFAGAPYIERLRGNRWLSAALSAITAAVVGVIFNLTLWFGLHVLFKRVETVSPLPGLDISWPDWASIDLLSLAIFIVAAVLLFRFRLGVEKLLALSAATGMMLFMARLV
ncbi:chromate efflux transporter [Rhizobium sp. RU36D]|uniref:chromate efflux transporter n=1 Tax=Rhizobium sp. RU36D TaxID=1907415 RepID=UPI0009D7A2E3|nr:chromate efflux transporter [Rhizobium sp. RU36D]SMD16647.1 chromate transporter [Rhizobium sp. RU36D]